MGYFVLVVELFPLSTRWLAMSLTQGLTFCTYAASSSIGLWLACNISSRMLWLYAAVNAFATVRVPFFSGPSQPLFLRIDTDEPDRALESCCFVCLGLLSHAWQRELAAPLHFSAQLPSSVHALP